MSIAVAPKQTPGFFLQAVLSFVVSVCAVLAGVAYLPVDGWTRAFLMVGVLYAITSSFTLAKCVRDQHDTQTVIHRVDEARLDKFLAEHDPFHAAPLI
ncbi:MAG: YiaA/YiaB family inner membrane protein [Ilumatobacteraceae bacterium]